MKIKNSRAKSTCDMEVETRRAPEEDGSIELQHVGCDACVLYCSLRIQVSQDLPYSSFAPPGCQQFSSLDAFPYSVWFLLDLSICPSIYLSILSYLYIYLYLSLCLSIYLSVCLSIYLSVCLSIYLSISLCLSLSLSLSLSVCLPVCPSIYLQAWKCSLNVRWKVFDLNAPRVSLPLLPAVYPKPVPSRSLGCSFARKWARTVGRFVASLTPTVSRSPLISTTSLRNGDGWIMRMQWKFIGTYWSMNGT